MISAGRVNVVDRRTHRASALKEKRHLEAGLVSVVIHGGRIRLPSLYVSAELLTDYLNGEGIS